MGTIGTKNSFSEPLEPRALVLSENDAKIYFWNFRRPLLSFCNLNMALNFKMLWSTSLWTCYLKTGNSTDLNVFKLFFFTWHWKQSLGQVVLRRAVKLYRYHWVCLIHQCSCYQEMPVSNPLIGILGSLIVFLLSTTHKWVPDLLEWSLVNLI